MNFQTKKPWVSASHRDPNNRLVTDRASKYGMILDKESEGKPRVERQTSAGTVVFEQGLAVVPDDARGNDIAHELMANGKYPEQYNYHTGRRGMTLKQDRQTMWRLPSWNTKCKAPGCENEAAIQRLCEEHWGQRWAD